VIAGWNELFFNHGWTPMDTDVEFWIGDCGLRIDFKIRATIRVHPCASVVKQNLWDLSI